MRKYIVIFVLSELFVSCGIKFPLIEDFRKPYPTYLTEEHKEQSDIIVTDYIYMSVNPNSEFITISDSNYVISGNIKVYSYTNDTMYLTIRTTNACLKNKENQNQVFDATINSEFDSIKILPQATKTVPFKMKFKYFNNSYIEKMSDFENYNLEIMFSDILVNNISLKDKKGIFFCTLL
ncbi:hypothetical protein D0T53_01960 [Dysgonomonas sp. 216]|uniref:hypothetical protein n=1 Tax=Dysgonomonas sp. 216 TaxID=2302934 RepID=UPI0013D4B185|nr:hypothetical protein [Dysgonomonas sp. 216]NDW17680.1 hypothetical protein [Dysgonomonas sp. 216]